MEKYSEATLKDIAVFIRTGKTPPSKTKKYFNGNIIWVTPGDFGDNMHIQQSARTISEEAIKCKKAVIFPKGTVLISCIGDIGKVGVSCETESSSNQQITGIFPKENILAEYLYYWVKSNKNALEYYANKAVVPILNNAALAKLKIKYPDIKGQKSIVDILNAAKNLRQKRKQQLALLDDYLKFVFLDMFGDPRSGKKWEMIDFGEVIDVLTDYHANGSYEILRNHVELKSTSDYALMVRTTDLENNNFTNGVKYISKEAYEFLEKSKVFGGEIIVNKIGSAGNVYLMPHLDRPVSLGMNAFLLRFNDTVNDLFIYYLLTSDYGKSIIGARVKGAVTKTIRKDAIRGLKIPLPPIELQESFASILNRVEQTKQKMRASLGEMNNHFNALMQRYFG